VKLYLDANVIIYAHEASLALRNAVMQRLVDWCRRPDGNLVTSLFARLECKVVPLRNADAALLADYDRFFRGDAVEIVEITRDIIDLAAMLRAQHGFRSPDAIYLATALHLGVDLFLTADKALKKCPGLNVDVLAP
jgi:predicted nucleic acid-binding protein